MRNTALRQPLLRLDPQDCELALFWPHPNLLLLLTSRWMVSCNATTRTVTHKVPKPTRLDFDKAAVHPSGTTLLYCARGLVGEANLFTGTHTEHPIPLTYPSRVAVEPDGTVVCAGLRDPQLSRAAIVVYPTLGAPPVLDTDLPSSLEPDDVTLLGRLVLVRGWTTDGDWSLEAFDLRGQPVGRLDTRWCHEDMLDVAEASPCGRLVVFSGPPDENGPSLCIWDLRTHTVRRCTGIHFDVGALRFTPDSTRLVALNPDGDTRAAVDVSTAHVMWQHTCTRSEAHPSLEDADQCALLATSPSGDQLALAHFDFIELLDAHTGESTTPTPADIHQLQLARSDHSVLTLETRLTDHAQTTVLRRISADGVQELALDDTHNRALGPDTTLYVEGDDGLHIVSTESGTGNKVADGWFNHQAWSGPRHVVAHYSDGSTPPWLGVWNATTGALTTRLEGAAPPSISKLVVGACGTVLAAFCPDQHTAWRWALDSGAALPPITDLPPRTYTLVLAGDRAVGVVQYHTLLLWDGPTHRTADLGRVSTLALSPCGRRLILADHQGDIRVVDFDSLTVLATLVGHHNPVIRLVPGPDHTLVSASRDGELRSWCLKAWL